MKKFKNNKGITLMSLVITIIILIILASVGTYSGIKIVNSSKLTAFTTELKIMQVQVNELYDKNSREEINISEIGEPLSTVQTQVDKVFTENESGIILTESSNYRYYDQQTIKNDLGIEGVEGEYFVDVQKRSVVSFDGLNYDGETYYTLKQLPNNLYNVDYEESNTWNSELDSFDVSYTELEQGKYRITVSDIDYKSGNINNWRVKYKKEGEDNWKQTDSYSFIIDEVGNYRMKIANNNIESNEKQISVRLSLLPSEYQQVEYIESTGTQFIDTGITAQNMPCIETLFCITSRDPSTQAVLGCRSKTAGASNFEIFANVNGTNLRLDWVGDNKCFHGIKLNEYNDLVLKKDGSIIINNTEYSNKIIKDKCNYNILIGNFNDSNGSPREIGAYTKWKKFIIYENDYITRNYIPCYRKLDQVSGMYDILSDEFYTNQGTGEFLKGDNIENISINDI